MERKPVILTVPCVILTVLCVILTAPCVILSASEGSAARSGSESVVQAPGTGPHTHIAALVLDPSLRSG